MPNPFNEEFEAAYEEASSRSFAPLDKNSLAIIKDLKIVSEGDATYVEKTFYFPEVNATETDRIYIKPTTAGVLKGFMKSVGLEDVPMKKIAEGLSSAIGLKVMVLKTSNKVKDDTKETGFRTYYRFKVTEIVGRDESASKVSADKIPF